jgi:SAM-dependent methyltransferase
VCSTPVAASSAKRVSGQTLAVPKARYDGLADWYDQEQARIAKRSDAPVEQLALLVGPGAGLFVELGCGTGLTAMALQAQGWTVAGLDISADQLAIARSRCRSVVHGDAHQLPFRSASVTALGMAFVHTDVDAFEKVMREIGRVLAPGGRVAHLGVHPCFVGHHVDSPDKSEMHLGFGPGYRDAMRVDDCEQFGPGIRSRVGARHVPLGPFLMAFIDAGLVFDECVELGEGLVPWMLGVTAHKPS